MQKISVKNTNDGVISDYSIRHAEQLLNLEKRLGVENYVIENTEFAFENGTIVRRSNSEDKKASKRSTVKEG